MTKGTHNKRELLDIELSKIDRPDVIDRIEIDQTEIQELADNIEKQDQLQPVILRPRGSRYETVAGDRRIMAVKLLGWNTVWCVIRELSDRETAEIRASENLQRKDLSVIEEGRIYKNLHQNHDLSIEQISRKMGKAPGTVKRRMDLLKMPQPLQDAMHRKEISYGVGEALWPISDKTALDYYLSFAIDHGVTVAIARQWCNDWKASTRRAEMESTDPVEALTSPAIRPTYIACDICEQPELIQDLAIVRICKECAKRMAEAE